MTVEERRRAELDRAILDARLVRLGHEPRPRRRFVHRTVGKWNQVVPCGRPDCDMCYPRRSPGQRLMYR